MIKNILALKPGDQLRDTIAEINAVVAYRKAAYAVMVRPKRSLKFGETGVLPDTDRPVLAWYGLPDYGDVPAVVRYDTGHRTWLWHSTGAPVKQTIRRWLELPE